MKKLSVIILTLNEEEIIADALDSVSWADEVIVVDSGSSDNTGEIVKKKRAAFFVHPFENFALQREYALSKASGEFALYLDADELVDSVLQKSIKEELRNPSYDGYKIHRKNFYLGRQWPQEEEIVRLFRKNKLQTWFGEVHETAKVNGSIGSTSGHIIHRTHRSLKAMLDKTIVWSKVEARIRFKEHHPPVTWWRILRVMSTTFFDYFFNQKGYRVGSVGLIESIYQSYSIFITYARLWELQQQKTT